ncbi:hypothetical protein AB1L42_11365 [Thalassoglobus sp. JC818]|uniref:hypothetical protein n=1 Tax=Thalassoglobus sp. JC818 TaxID=3232136 RepID=UPI0034594C1B
MNPESDREVVQAENTEQRIEVSTTKSKRKFRWSTIGVGLSWGVGGIFLGSLPIIVWRVCQRFPIPGDASVHYRFHTLSGVIMIPVVLASGVILLVAGNDWNHGRPKRALLLDVLAYALLLIPELMHQYAVHVL